MDLGSPQHGITSDDELRFGKNVAGAARAAGVRHLVYMGGCTTGRPAWPLREA
ncbi:hypothetical protein [Sorangium cellulosum]|uniref:hypothetical protein n=1 Tax=Sorangium cellulosum TaxID=56 RepID=UPI0013312781|nr:hypothetical protein [Sorangium cellulosum]